MKSIRRILAMGLALLLLFASLAGCSSGASTSTSPAANTSPSPEALKTVKFGYISLETAESFKIAMDQGYLEEELAKVGYEPEYATFSQAGPAVNEAISAKAIDFAVYADFPQLVIRDKGIDIRAIAPVNSAQNYAVVVQGDSGIESAKDLEGKNIIVAKGTILQKVFEDWVADAGADLSKINTINATTDAQSVFASGEADAILTTFISASIIKSNVENSKFIFSTSEKTEWAGVFTMSGRGEYLDENPEAAKAIVRALYRAYQYASADPEKAYIALSTEKASEELIKAVYGADPSFSNFKPEFNQESLARIEQTNTFLFNQELISQKVDISQYVDTQYYDAVKNEFEN